jgi:hypothetical protein
MRVVLAAGLVLERVGALRSFLGWLEGWRGGYREGWFGDVGWEGAREEGSGEK